MLPNNYGIQGGYGNQARVQEERAQRTLDLLRKALREKNLSYGVAFRIFDKNYNNVVEYNELYESLQSLRLNITLEDINALFNKLDVNQNGRILSKEFVAQLEAPAYTQYTQIPQTPEDTPNTHQLVDDTRMRLRNMDRNNLSRLFESFNINKNREVSNQQFIMLIRSVNPSIPDNTAQEIFKLVDINRSGIIPFTELARYFDINPNDIRPKYVREVAKMCETITQFMSEDNLAFNKLFLSKDLNNNGTITAKDFKEALLQKLSIESTRNIYLMTEFVKNKEGSIDLFMLRKFLGQGSNMRIWKFEEISGFMIEDRLSFNQLFLSKDSKNTGTITAEDFRETLIEELRLDDNPQLDPFIEFAKNKEGNIDLFLLRKFLDEEVDLEEDINVQQHLDDLNQALRKMSRIDLSAMFAFIGISNKSIITSELFNNIVTRVGVTISYNEREKMYKIINANPYGILSCTELTKYFNIDPPITLDDMIIMTFQSIANAMKEADVTFDKLFSSIDVMKEGTITENDFKAILLQELSMNETRAFDLVTEYLRNQNRKIDLAILEKCLNQGPNTSIVKILDEINRFMMADNLSFNQLFSSKDFKRDGTITEEDFRAVLLQDLHISNHPMLSLLIQYFKNKSEDINLFMLKRHLGQGYDMFAPVFSRENKERIDRILLRMQKFMKKEGLNFDQLFSSKDFNKDGTITEQDFRAALLQDSYLCNHPMLGLLIEFIKNKEGNIDLVLLRKYLNQEFDTDVKKMFAAIAEFIKIDKLNFDQLFSSKDIKRDGTITEQDFRAVLSRELYIDFNSKLELFIEFLKNQEGNIDLAILREHLKLEADAIKPVPSLANFIQDLKGRFNNNTEDIIKFFDFNRTPQIGRREFVEGCRQAVGIDKELSLFYFSQLDIRNAGEISIAYFREVIETNNADLR